MNEQKDILIEFLKDKHNALEAIIIPIDFFYLPKDEQTDMFERIRISVNNEILKSAH